jgi:hypothetical protein
MKRPGFIVQGAYNETAFFFIVQGAYNEVPWSYRTGAYNEIPWFYRTGCLQ